MYNYFMLIGRLTTKPELIELKDNKKVVNLSLAVVRPFKNQDGTYQTDFFKISIWDFLAEYACDYLKKGSKIAIKGRLTAKKETLASGVVVTMTELVGERLMFFDAPIQGEDKVTDEEEKVNEDLNED